MAISRRQFITRTGLATAGMMFGPSLFHTPWLRRAMASTIGDRYLIVLFLDGGNDGLNTVIPVTGALRTAYEAARNTGPGGLRIASPLVPSTSFSDPNTGDQLGFHPGFASLRDLYDQGMVAVIQGAGYPQYSLSHDVSRSIWRQGAPLSTPGTGWVGRYLAASGYASADIPAVNVGSEVAGEYLQTATSVLVFDQLSDFGFPYDQSYYDPGQMPLDPLDDTPFKDTAFNALYGAASASGNSVMRYLGSTGSSTLLATSSYPQLHSDYEHDRASFGAMYPKTSTARGLREIAKVIYGVARGVPNVNARLFELGNGGYDTHSNQGADDPSDQQYKLHQEVGDALKVFFADLANIALGAPSGSGKENLASKVCVMVWSEFSRRIDQNDSGTDHGSQGPMVVVGGVHGGVYGEHPNIDSAALDDDGNTVYKQDHSNGARSTDMRDVYGTIIKHWLGVTSSSTLASLLPLDTALGYSGADYWTAANFDMAFLP